MAVGAGASLDAATLNATLGANSLSVKVGLDNLMVMKASLDAYTAQQMITDAVDGLGLSMTIEEATEVKTALAEVQSVVDALNATVALKRTWGLGVG